jgi:hypothetical protein
MTLRQAPMPARHQHSRHGVSTSSTSGTALRQEWRKYETSVSFKGHITTSTYVIIGPLPWLMTKEFSSELSAYHALFKVSVWFMNGKLQKWFVSTACPDPFCGENGPTPEGCVAVFCTSNSAGATLEHYHIPASDLSPAPPRKKNQECLILDGVHRGVTI